ncbi:MAG: TIGR03617 family F420-dependent LLM class oxidoreductase [Gammaproteobacteria bacterium]|nr:TIGR03617 family F420-dependent LLM class oxidoreductase [Gammaproteobacteria bacterium]
MKFDTLFRASEFSEAGAEAAAWEDIGFDCIWGVESGHNPFIPLTLAASATQSIDLGTNIAVAFARSPFSMAQVAWDLQALSQGRFHLGLGTQVRAHVERRFSMDFTHPAARLTDYIRCLKAIWDSFQNDRKPDYRGPYYRFELINPMFNPGPIDHPNIPIYVAGVNPRMCRVAGEVADGFHVHPIHSMGYLRDVVVPAIDEGARPRGKTAKDLELYGLVFVVTGGTQAEMDRMLERVRKQIAFYASTPSYRAMLEYHGQEGVGRQLSKLARAGDFDDMATLISDDLLEEIAVVAPIDKLGQALWARCEGVLDRISLYDALEFADTADYWRTLIRDFRAAAEAPRPSPQA